MKYQEHADPVTAREKLALIMYPALIAMSIVVAPLYPSDFLETMQPFVASLPAANKLVAISQMPGKTLAWLTASIVFSPVALVFSFYRFHPMKLQRQTGPQLAKIWKGLLIADVVLSPWLFLTFYREDMTRGGSLISAMGSSEAFLIGCGSLISLIYATIYSSTIIVGIGYLRRQRHG